MQKPPAFQFYVKDWLTSKAVLRMSPSQRGYYIHLLAHAWDSDTPGTLPNDPDLLWHLAGAASKKEFAKDEKLVLEQFPVLKNGARCNGKLRGQYRERRKFIASRREAGMASVRSRRMIEAKRKGTHTKHEWRALLEFCAFRCVKCGAERHLDRDHILPVYRGGSDSIENIQPLCAPCNASKGPESVDYRLDGWRTHVATRVELVLNTKSTLQSSSSSSSSTKDLNLPATAAEFQGHKLRITTREHLRFLEVFPGMDLTGHYREADFWMETHPEKKYKNHFAFMRNWLKKERQNPSAPGVKGNPSAAVGAGPAAADFGVKPSQAALDRMREREERERALDAQRRAPN